jgi:hypothetical protein
MKITQMKFYDGAKDKVCPSVSSIYRVSGSSYQYESLLVEEKEATGRPQYERR